MMTLSRLAALVILTLSFADPARAADCTSDDFAKAVDDAGAKLRALNQANAAKLRDRMRRLKDKRGWQDADYEAKALAHLRDTRISELDARANELFTTIDTLGQPPPGEPLDCTKLAALSVASNDLLAVMSAKTAHLIAKLDAELGTGAASKPAAAPPPAPARAPAASPGPETVAPGQQQRSAEITPPPATPGPLPQGPAPGTAPLPDIALDSVDGYTIDEIRDATRGFFGTISTNLAAVIEYAFSSYGRPAGYVLGKEGGGALLAGVRYGSGTLYMRTGGEHKVYWHGPSLGYDFGAEGSRTLFLIYHLAEPEALFRTFTGVDGSAYLVGGVGLTLLKGGDVIMAPIRSGLGLRLGANLGYVRFTPRATWNPF